MTFINMPPLPCRVKSQIFFNEYGVSTKSKNTPATALQPHKALFAEEASINSKKSGCTSVNCRSPDSTYCIIDPRIPGQDYNEKCTSTDTSFQSHFFQWKFFYRGKRGEKSSLNIPLLFHSLLAHFCCLIMFSCLCSAAHTAMLFYGEGFL